MGRTPIVDIAAEGSSGSSSSEAFWQSAARLLNAKEPTALQASSQAHPGQIVIKLPKLPQWLTPHGHGHEHTPLGVQPPWGFQPPGAIAPPPYSGFAPGMGFMPPGSASHPMMGPMVVHLSKSHPELGNLEAVIRKAHHAAHAAIPSASTGFMEAGEASQGVPPSRSSARPLERLRHATAFGGKGTGTAPEPDTEDTSGGGEDDSSKDDNETASGEKEDNPLDHPTEMNISVEKDAAKGKPIIIQMPGVSPMGLFGPMGPLAGLGGGSYAAPPLYDPLYDPLAASVSMPPVPMSAPRVGPSLVQPPMNGIGDYGSFVRAVAQDVARLQQESSGSSTGFLSASAGGAKGSNSSFVEMSGPEVARPWASPSSCRSHAWMADYVHPRQTEWAAFLRQD